MGLGLAQLGQRLALVQIMHSKYSSAYSSDVSMALFDFLDYKFRKTVFLKNDLKSSILLKTPYVSEKLFSWIQYANITTFYGKFWKFKSFWLI